MHSILYSASHSQLVEAEKDCILKAKRLHSVEIAASYNETIHANKAFVVQVYDESNPHSNPIYAVVSSHKTMQRLGCI